MHVQTLYVTQNLTGLPRLSPVTRPNLVLAVLGNAAHCEEVRAWLHDECKAWGWRASKASGWRASRKGTCKRVLLLAILSRPLFG